MSLTPTQQVTNIVTVANIIEVTKQTLNKVGFEYHAPLEPSEINELVSKEVNKIIQNSDGNTVASDEPVIGA